MIFRSSLIDHFSLLTDGWFMSSASFRPFLFQMDEGCLGRRVEDGEFRFYSPMFAVSSRIGTSSDHC
jgi:hypothetical protein